MLQEYLLQSAQAVVGREQRCDPDVVREAARSVAVHCANQIRLGIDTRQLHVLFSRALWSVGETTAAQRMLELGVESRRIRSTLMALLDARALAPELWPLVGSGTIRYHESWLAVDSESVWCLDTTQIPGWADETELAQSLAIQRILKEVAPVWDRTAGRGCLASRGEVGCGSVGWQIDVLRAWLQKCASRRGWSAIPRVIQLEISA